MTKPVTVNLEQCKELATRLKPLSIRKDHLNRPYIALNVDLETRLRAYIYSVAICHQTHTLINKIKNIKGWEVLEDVFTKLALQNSPLLKAGYLAQKSIPEIITEIKPLFAPDNNPKNCNLDRLEERAQFLKEIDEITQKEFTGELTTLLKKSNQLISNGIGLYELLEKYPCYKDPLRKKSGVLIKFLVEANLWKFTDPENWVPIMDYHMQRVLLRTGAIKVNNEKLATALKTKQPLTSDKEVRETSVDAINIITQETGISPLEIQDYFWTLGRSCCKEKMLCVDKTCNKNPCSFEKIVNLPNHTNCIFAGVCKGSKDAEYRKFWQPIVDTHFY